MPHRELTLANLQELLRTHGRGWDFDEKPALNVEAPRFLSDRHQPSDWSAPSRAVYPIVTFRLEHRTVRIQGKDYPCRLITAQRQIVSAFIVSSGRWWPVPQLEGDDDGVISREAVRVLSLLPDR